MQQIEETIQRLSFSGAVDADGHVLEPPDLWERYIDPSFRARAVRIIKDASGEERLEVGSQPSKFMHGARLASLGAMGARRDDRIGDRFRGGYGSVAPFGAMDPAERLARIDREGLAAAFLYPTLSLVYETECADAALAQACTRAYNRWIVDFCSESGGRLVPIAHLSLGDPAAAAQELERAVRAGCRGGWVAQFAMTRKPHGHPDHNVLFAKAQELDVPLGIHPTLEPVWALPGRYDFQYLRGHRYFLNVTAADAIRHAFTSFFEYAVFDKFPRLKLVLLEAGAGWISYWLDRMDAVFESLLGRQLSLREKPSIYFQRQCWISADPDEHALPAMVELCGAEKFFWASDFPHPDHVGNYIDEVEHLAGKLQEPARQRVMGENVMRVYGCRL